MEIFLKLFFAATVLALALAYVRHNARESDANVAAWDRCMESRGFDYCQIKWEDFK